MRLSRGGTHGSGGTGSAARALEWDEFDPRPHGAAWRRGALAVAAVLVFGAIGVVISPAKPAGATVFQSGQVFASVGNSTVNVYDPSSGNLVTSLTDATSQDYTVGSAFDSTGDFYVADDLSGEVSEYSPNGTYTGVFASGLANPISLVFDNQGNLYVGQQQTPYIAEFNSSGQNVANFGPVTTQETGDDWIDLASDECTFYYTTEGNEIFRYNKCTNTQEPVFNQQPLTGANAFQVKILQNGDVLVADSQAVDLLDPNGNLIQTYNCDPTVLPDCGGQFFAIALDPDGTSFWTADAFSGNIYRIDIATGQLLQTIQTGSAYLYGLSIENELNAATPPQAATVPSTLAIQPVSGNFSTPTPVSAILTNPDTQAPLVNEPVTFTLNGDSSESCTATTDSTGTATCDITASQPSSTYTLTASFPGDSTTSVPIGSDSTSSTFTVNPDTSALSYTGPTSGVNGQPITLTGTLTTDTPTTGTPLPTKVVTFTIGSGSTAQSCNAVTDTSGDVSCTIPALDQPQTSETVTSTFTADAYDTASTVSTPVTITEPTTLTVNPTTGAYGGATTVSGVLTDSNTNTPIANEPVTFILNGNETCTGTTDSTGTASCTITPGEPAATYTLSGSFGGDTTLPLQLNPSSGSNNFVVTLAQTALTYTGGTVAQNGQSLTVSGVLTTNNPVPGSGLAGRTVSFTLGSGSTAQTCSGTTSATGAVSCTIAVTGQPPGPIPVTDTFGGDVYYQPANAGSTVNLPEGTTLTVTSATGPYNGSTPLTGTLVNTYTNQPVPNEPVTLTLNGAQSCTATTNASGVATCPVTPTEPPSTYSVTGTFGGDKTTTPVLLASSGSSTFTETKASTTVTYTGSTSTTSGQAPSLSATLTTSSGAPLPGQTVTFTVGTGSSAQHCSATTNAAGQASCSICSYNQSASPLPVTVSYGGNTDYSSSSTSKSVTVVTPTSLSVSATTATYNQPVTLNGTLTNSVTGQGISGQTVTLTLNGSQSCTATTGSYGKASCTVTPTEPSGTYSLTGSFAGNTATNPQLLSSNGSNKVVVNGAPTTLTYTGAASVDNGQSLTLSATLTNNGTPLANQPVVLTLGTGRTAQSCNATTNASGVASCSVSVNQLQGSVTVTVSYAGSSYYQSSSASSTVNIGCEGGGGSSGGGGGNPCGGGGCGGGYSEPPPTGGGRGCA
jgi:sugar lactone lactonase YvrE